MKISEEDLGKLTNLAEECCEVQKVVSKIIRFGWDSHHPDDPDKTPNIIRLAHEVGNVLAMIDIVDLPKEEVLLGVRMKKDGIKKHGLMAEDVEEEEEEDSPDDKLNNAYYECKAYIRMGALNDGMIADIAHDFGVTVKAIKKRIGWD